SFQCSKQLILRYTNDIDASSIKMTGQIFARIGTVSAWQSAPAAGKFDSPPFV
ncbi:hypothetical protein ABH945_007329, partial [Paraburkholderia sp. GAS333]